MSGRCHILATRVTPGAFRCPSTMHRFHFHGEASGPVIHILTGTAPCAHRHASIETAERCTADPARPVLLSDAIRRRRLTAAR